MTQESTKLNYSNGLRNKTSLPCWTLVNLFYPVLDHFAELSTGAGKTLIAVLLLRHVLDEELKDRQLGKKPRIAFFLVSFSMRLLSYLAHNQIG